MISKIKNLLFGPSVDYKQLLANGGIILDVRTKGEFGSGNIKGSKNVPLDTLSTFLNKLDKKTPIITCCASGMRSGSAKKLLKSNGFTQVYNGGGWMTLKNKI
jgi:rhodanese-related sulfurtransferase